MTVGPRLRLALAALLVAGAAALALLAVLAWRVPGVMRAHDERLLSDPQGSIAWSRGETPVLALLGGRDDVTYRRAILLFLRARALLDPTNSRSSDAVVAAVEAGVLLERIENGELDRERRSEASNLDAVLIGQGAELDGDTAGLRHAADLLRSAIRLARSDEAAKANLERLQIGRAHV